MLYAVSDLHGEYRKFLAMLERIAFSDGDTLFVLGDVIDRGPEPVALLRDLSRRPNVAALAGNHEIMALGVIPPLLEEITAENAESRITPEFLVALAEYRENGGGVTLEDFRRLPPEERQELIEYIREFSVYEETKAGGREFLLVHSGLSRFSPERELDDYSLEELTVFRPDYRRAVFPEPDKFIVVGHTPTLAITGKPEIYREGRYINIDCGACFPGGRLACLRLDDLAEFYV